MNLDSRDVERTLLLLDAQVAQAMIELPDSSAFIAGGFIRSAISGERPSDVDIFVSSEDVMAALLDKLGGADKAYQTEFAYTFPGATPVQVIKKWTFTSAEEILAHFDFTIAKAVLCRQDGNWQGACDPMFYVDLAARRLSVSAEPREERDAAATILRLLKFTRRGYFAAPETVAQIVFEGCRRCGSFEELRSILREIDPLHRPQWMEANA